MPTARRTILRLRIRVGGETKVYRFQADRWHTFRVYVPLGTTQLQVLDKVPLTYVRQVTLLMLESSVEGVVWWKVDSSTPLVGTTAVSPTRELRPLEVTTDYGWSQSSVPAIVIRNSSTQNAQVKILFATREEGESLGNYDVGDADITNIGL